MGNEEVERRFDGSHMQWLMKQDPCSTIVRMQENLRKWHPNNAPCILDIIFEENAPDQCAMSCEACIRDFIYRKHH